MLHYYAHMAFGLSIKYFDDSVKGLQPQQTQGTDREDRLCQNPTIVVARFSEAIQRRAKLLDCFVAVLLAMTDGLPPTHIAAAEFLSKALKPFTHKACRVPVFQPQYNSAMCNTLPQPLAHHSQGLSWARAVSI